jgi:hypothetical protein
MLLNNPSTLINTVDQKLWLLTARQTLCTRKRDLYGFPKDARAAALHGAPTPSLLPAHLRTDLRAAVAARTGTKSGTTAHGSLGV